VVQFAGLPVANDVAAGRWIADAVAGSSPGTVAALVPAQFPAVARVFHPAVRYVGDVDVEVSWSAVADANGALAHSLMQWGSVTGSMEYFENDDQAPLWHGAPARGHLPAALAERMIDVLTAHTRTPDDCWFGVQDGGAVSSDSPLLHVGGRGYWLVRGPISLAVGNMAAEPFEQSVNLWWPVDRAWVVATEAELVSTYVAGSVECIAALLAVPGLETAAAEAGHEVAWDADLVNPLPEDGPAATDRG
jgi:hypothetical protein